MKGISRGAARLKAVAVFALLAWTGALLASCGGASPAASVDYNVIATAALQNLTVGTEIPAAAAELAKVTISLANVEAKSDFPEAGDLDAVSWIKYKSVGSDAGEESFAADPTTHASAIGLKATAKASASEAGKAKDTITMTFSGTFSAAFEGTLTAIVIPAARLSSGKDLRVELKSGDAAESGIKVKIVNAGAPISENAADIYAFDAATADAAGFVVEYVLSAKFSAAVAAGATDVFEATGLPTGVTASVAEAVAADANRIKIKFAAGATAAASESVSDVRIKFKKEKLSGADADIEIAEPVKVFIRKAAAQRKAVIGGGAVSGETRKAIEPKTLTITLDGDVIASDLNAVVDSSKPETDASRYFDVTNLIDGLEATGLKARLAADVAKGAKSFNIVVYGTPAWNAAGYAGAITGTIPASIEDGDDEIKVLTGAAGIPVAKADSDTTTALSIVMKPYGTVSGTAEEQKKISAITGSAIPENTTLTITLRGARFKALADDTIVAGEGLAQGATAWFTNLPAGIVATAAQADASDTAIITLAGTPSAVSTALIAITIPAASLIEADSAEALGADITVDANENCLWDIRNPYATVAGTEDSPNSFVAVVGNPNNQLGQLDITLHGTAFAGIPSNDVIGWFGASGTDYPAGMTATLIDSLEDSASICIGYDGTGDSIFEAKPFKIVIPGNCLSGQNQPDLEVDSNAFATIEVRNPYATVYATENARKLVTGFVSYAIESRNIVLTINGGTFAPAAANSPVSWIGNLPNGLTAVIYNAIEGNETHEVIIRISGTPTVTSDEALVITIPAESWSGSASLTVEANEFCRFNIRNPYATVSGSETTPSEIEGSIGNSIQEQTVTLELNCAKFVEFTDNNKNVTAWFKNLPTGLSATANVQPAGTSVVVTISGTPSVKSTAALEITIPAEMLTDINNPSNALGEAIVVDANPYCRFNIGDQPD